MEKNLTKSPEILLNVEDYHKQAKEKLGEMIYNYYNTGSDDQLTLFDNKESFRRIKLCPKMLLDVSLNSTEVNLNNGIKISFPCIIAPTALHRLANNEYGELATVRAAVACSTIMCVSTTASIRMEILADEHQKQIKYNYPHSQSQLWYQLYVFKDRQFTKNLIQRAENCGYKALVITVDSCERGNREFHTSFILPDGIKAENLIDDNTDISETYRNISYDASLIWNDLHWIRSITSLPIIIKGIIHPDDVQQAIKYNVQAIIISNHGGRQLDTCISTIDALYNITKTIGYNHQIDIYVDGGIRRGTDILKAIALGAKAVLIGRPVLWGLAVDGENGVKNILQILKKEFRLAMMLCGCKTIEDIRKNNLLIINDKNITSKL